MSKEETNLQTENPENLSGHALVDYLIANPEVRGDFKYHTLRSCMWRDLLIAQPGFADVADFAKLYRHDIYKLLLEQPQLAPHCDFSKLWDGENRWLFIKHPEIATQETTAYISPYAWTHILVVHPHLAVFCPFKEFYPYNWHDLLSKQPECLKCYKLEYFNTKNMPYEINLLYGIFYYGYLGEVQLPPDDSSISIPDAASYLIYKRIDRAGCKKFLKEKFTKNKWKFVEQLCSISPEDTLDVYKKQYIDFYMTLAAPDQVFEKLFHLFDLTKKDPAGNSFLMAALIHSLAEDDMTRYNFLLAKGLDPDEKNLAGFSCSDLTALIEKQKEKDEKRRLARKARAEARKQAKEQEKKQTKKGK